MNKLEALKAAQDVQIAAAKNGKMFCLDFDCDLKCWELSDACDDGTVVERFPYEDPKPLARNSIAMCFDGMVRYALGEILNGIHKFAKPGYTADTNLDNRYDGLKDGEFEIIETPTDLETMQTPDAVCREKKCKITKWFDGGVSQVINPHCQQCRISVSEPTGLKGELWLK